MKKLNLLRALLYAGSLFYLVGAVVHFFGLTLFPFYVATLYSPYHDSVIAMASLLFGILFLVTARDPVKNKDTLFVMIIGVALAAVFSFAIIWKVDFAVLGAPARQTQSLIEGGVALAYFAVLWILYPR